MCPFSTSVLVVAAAFGVGIDPVDNGSSVWIQCYYLIGMAHTYVVDHQ